MMIPIPTSVVEETSSASVAAKVSHDTFYELLTQFEEPPFVLQVKKTWPSRFAYVLQHPAGLLVMTSEKQEDFSGKARIIEAEDLAIPHDLNF